MLEKIGAGIGGDCTQLSKVAFAVEVEVNTGDAVDPVIVPIAEVVPIVQEPVKLLPDIAEIVKLFPVRTSKDGVLALVLGSTKEEIVTFPPAVTRRLLLPAAADKDEISTAGRVNPAVGTVMV